MGYCAILLQLPLISWGGFPDRHQASMGVNGLILDQVGQVVIHLDLQSLINRHTQTIPGAQLWIDTYWL